MADNATPRPRGHQPGVPLTDAHRAAIAAGVRARRASDMRDLVSRIESIVDRVEALDQEDTHAANG